jgi:hypothetical protein
MISARKRYLELLLDLKLEKRKEMGNSLSIWNTRWKYKIYLALVVIEPRNSPFTFTV